jgi:hypothetical protein
MPRYPAPAIDEDDTIQPRDTRGSDRVLGRFQARDTDDWVRVRLVGKVRRRASWKGRLKIWGRPQRADLPRCCRRDGWLRCTKCWTAGAQFWILRCESRCLRLCHDRPTARHCSRGHAWRPRLALLAAACGRPRSAWPESGHRDPFGGLFRHRCRDPSPDVPLREPVRAAWGGASARAQYDFAHDPYRVPSLRACAGALFRPAGSTALTIQVANEAQSVCMPPPSGKTQRSHA